MAITLVGTPTTAVGASITATTLTITAPTGSTGDLLLIGVSSASQATAGSTAPFITASSANTVRLGFVPGATNSMTLFYRVVQAGDPTTYTFTVNAGSPYGAVAARYSGVSATTPWRSWNVAASLDTFAVTTTSGTFPASSNARSTDLAVVFAAMGTGATSTTQTTALSTPSGWTNVVSSFGPTSATSSYRTACAMYSKLAGSDTPAFTGATGQFNAVRVTLIDSSAPVVDAPGGTIAFVGSTSVATSVANTATLTVNTPTGVVDGNMLILVAASSTGFETYTVPAGWISIAMGSGRYGMGTTSQVGASIGQAWYKIASGEPANYTVTRTAAGGTTQLAEYALAVVAYSGARNPYPNALTGTTMSTTTATTTTVAPYALPQVRSDTLVVNCYVAGTDAAGLVTMTGPSSPWNQRVSVVTTVSADFNAALIVSDKLAAADLPTATTSVATTSTVFSLVLVGEPAHQRLRTALQAVNRASTY